MKKIKSLINRLVKKISNIILVLISGVMCGILPVLIMYAGNQTTLSRIKKYGEESSQGIEAIKISNGINIVCGIILGIIGIGVVIAIIKVLLNKLDLFKNDYIGGTGYSASSREGNERNKSFDFDMKTSYVKDNFGNVVGKVQTTSYGDKYGGFEKREMLDNFGNKQGEVDTYKW